MDHSSGLSAWRLWLSRARPLAGQGGQFRPRMEMAWRWAALSGLRPPLERGRTLAAWQPFCEALGASQKGRTSLEHSQGCKSCPRPSTGFWQPLTALSVPGPSPQGLWGPPRAALRPPEPMGRRNLRPSVVMAPLGRSWPPAPRGPSSRSRPAPLPLLSKPSLPLGAVLRRSSLALPGAKCRCGRLLPSQCRVSGVACRYAPPTPDTDTRGSETDTPEG